jgi:hypothetical protein
MCALGVSQDTFSEETHASSVVTEVRILPPLFISNLKASHLRLAFCLSHLVPYIKTRPFESKRSLSKHRKSCNTNDF